MTQPPINDYRLCVEVCAVDPQDAKRLVEHLRDEHTEARVVSKMTMRKPQSKGGSDIATPAAWLVVSILGMCAVVYLKEFFKELGKRSAEYLFPKDQKGAHRGDNPKQAESSGTRPSPEVALSVAAKVSKYVYVIVELPVDAPGVSRTELWATIEDQVIPLAKWAVELHKNYYELWPELEPRPVVVQIAWVDGSWSVGSGIGGVRRTEPLPPETLEGARYWGLAFDKEIAEALHKSAESFLKAERVMPEEYTRRMRVLKGRVRPNPPRPVRKRRRKKPS